MRTCLYSVHRFASRAEPNGTYLRLSMGVDDPEGEDSQRRGALLKSQISNNFKFQISIANAYA